METWKSSKLSKNEYARCSRHKCRLQSTISTSSFRIKIMRKRRHASRELHRCSSRWPCRRKACSSTRTSYSGKACATVRQRWSPTSQARPTGRRSPSAGLTLRCSGASLTVLKTTVSRSCHCLELIICLIFSRK